MSTQTAQKVSNSSYYKDLSIFTSQMSSKLQIFFIKVANFFFESLLCGKVMATLHKFYTESEIVHCPTWIRHDILRRPIPRLL